MVLKTPHIITLYFGETEEKYNPVTDEFEAGTVTTLTVPCLVNRMTSRKMFEEYGSRDLDIISVRFNQEIPDFDVAEYEGEKYKRYEEPFTPRKKSVRLQRVVE